VETHDAPPGAAAAVDRKLLRIYLNDHLAGSVAGRRRMARTAHELSRTRVGPGIAQVVEEITQEREILRRILHRVGGTQARPKQIATGVAEALGRLKPDGRIFRLSPMTPLLEVEVLRAAVVGKLGVWQTLRDLASPLDLDVEELERLIRQTHAQIDTLDGTHEYLRTRALLQRA
jgi:hypothetical protein